MVLKKFPAGATLWFTGLPFSGKTTLAYAVGKELSLLGHSVEILDGDAIRKNISSDLGFSKKDRFANVVRVASVAELLTRQGILTLVSLVSPYRQMREEARSRISRFVEIYVRCPLPICEKRDIKGMYRLARQGKISHFTGVSDPYEEPLKAEIILDTNAVNVNQCLAKIMDYLRCKNFLLPVNPFPKNRLLTKAFELADYHHRGQQRKGGLPYITHPVSVARMLHAAGYGEEVVAAGLLHDVLEDTGCELEEMERVAGARVTRWVAQVTEKDKTLPWQTRKSNYLKSLKKASHEALAIAAADKTDNIHSLIEGMKRSGEKFTAMFTGKIKDKLANYEKVYKLIESCNPSCAILIDYRCHLDGLKEGLRK